MADIERGQRIKARRLELHLTQPAVVDLMEKAARELPEDHFLHGKAPVTLRGYQTYERGGGINWEKAKLLAQVLRMDAQAMMDGEPQPAETPTPFAGQDAIADRLAALEQRVSDQLAEHAARVEALLDRQSAILERIEQAIELEDEAARRLAADGEAWADETIRRARAEAQRPESPVPAPKRRAPAKSGTPKA